MASGRVIKLTTHVLLNATVPDLILVDNHTYVPEPSMDEEKRKLLYSHVLIPYSISCVACTFMDPLPKHIRNPQVLKHFFPSYTSCEPLVFRDEPFDLSFMRNRVF